jgi:hypothetical protein
MVIKIQGQQMDHNVMLLENELISITANIPTTLKGGNHGHAGLILANKIPHNDWRNTF